MKNFSKPLFIILVLAQLGVLGFMIQKRMLLLAHGQKILLECEPRDPRSLFSGDYVILNYKISTPDKNMLTDKIKTTLKQNNRIYVALQKNSNTPFWETAEIGTSLSVLKKQYPVVIRGQLKNKWSNTVSYGVEEYFVPQKQGLIIEKKMAQVSVEVSIAEDGESAINKLFIEGKEVEFY